MNNKDVVLKVKSEKSNKYFQPVITNNTVVIPASKLSEDIVKKEENNLVGREVETPIYKNLEKKESINSFKTNIGNDKVEKKLSACFVEPIESVKNLTVKANIKTVENIPTKKTPNKLNFEKTPVNKVQKEIKVENVPVNKVEKEIKLENVPVNKAEKEIKLENVPVNKAEKEIKLENVLVNKAEKEIKLENVPVNKAEKEIKLENISANKVQKELKLENELKVGDEEEVKSLKLEKDEEINKESFYNDTNKKVFSMKLEDMAKIFEEKQIELEKKQAMKNDATEKMDIPLEEPSVMESIPFRRAMEDNLSEMKSKLFLLASNAKKPVRICVNKKEFLMGSDYAKMDCVIRNNRYVSRCHAKIYYEAACYFLEDAGSMNGTYINGVKLAEGIKYKLETGDIVNLADCRFEVQIDN